MPTSKLDAGRLNPPPPSTNGVDNGSTEHSQNGGDGAGRSTGQKFQLDGFVPQMDHPDDSGVASGSSVLSASSNEALDKGSVSNGHPSSSNGHPSTARRSSPTNPPRVRFSDSDSSDNSSQPTIPAKDASSPGDGANPTLWLGDDQMLLLPGSGRSSEETDSNHSETSKSFEGLLSPNGTSILWDEDTDWILLFDNMIRYADRKQHRTTRACGCKGEDPFLLQSVIPHSSLSLSTKLYTNKEYWHCLEI